MTTHKIDCIIKASAIIGGGASERTYNEKTGLFDSGGSEFDESKHPRDSNGEFASKGGIQLSKQEYAQLRKEAIRKNAAGKGILRKNNTAFSANYFYIYSTDGYDGFQVLSQIKTENNEEQIDFLWRCFNV